MKKMLTSLFLASAVVVSVQSCSSPLAGCTKSLQCAINSETDPVKKAALEAQLKSYQAAEASGAANLVGGAAGAACNVVSADIATKYPSCK